MFRNKKGRVALCLAMALGAVLVSRPARAANITLQGTIATDDAVQLFDLTVATAGLALLLLGRARLRRATVLTGGLMVALTSVPVKAQTNCPSAPSGPNYCQVSDFLNGQRTLLQVTDLQIVNLVPSVGMQFTQVQTSNSNQTPEKPFGTIGLPLPGIDMSKVPLTFSAHMFNQPYAITITTMNGYLSAPNSTIGLWLQNIDNSFGDAFWTPLAQGDNPDIVAGAVADFNLDGFDDFALALADGRIFVLSPTSTDPKQEPFYQGHSGSPISKLNVLTALAAGDFKGDGNKELAGLTVTSNGGLALVIYTVDPNSLAVTLANTLNLTTPGASPSTPITVTSITSGRFNNLSHDQLAVTFATASGSPRAEVIDFAAGTLTPSEGPPLTVSNYTVPGGYLQVEAGKFGLPNNPFDQIVWHESSETAGARFFFILSADSSLNLTGHSGGVDYSQFPCAAHLQVGNFDNRQPNPSGQTEHNPNSQIAFLFHLRQPAI